MLRFEQKVLDIIGKLETALGQGSLKLKDFPLEDILHLIDTTLGGSMWNGIGSRPQGAFSQMVEEYKGGLARCMELDDIGQCIQILKLLACQYRCFYTAMGREEQLYREKTLRELLVRTGNTYAEAQSRALQCRQAGGKMGLARVGKAPEKNNTAQNGEAWEENHAVQNGKVPEKSSGAKGGEMAEESGLAGKRNPVAEGRGVVYTCLVKGEGQLPLPEYRNVFWDYICFTDREDLAGKTAGAWQFRLLSKEELQHTADSYYKYKVKPYDVLGEYDFSFWVDPQVQITGPLEQLYEIYGEGTSFVCFPAYDKDDLYEALNTTMTDDEENIRRRRKLMQYRKEGFPEHYGLIHTQMMFRSHRDEVLKQVMEDWWREMHECKALIDYGFSYAAWKHGFRYALCGLFAENNLYIKNGDIDLELAEI